MPLHCAVLWCMLHAACSFCMLLILHIWQNLLLVNGWMHSPWTHPFTAAVCCYLEKDGTLCYFTIFTLKYRHNLSSEGRTLWELENGIHLRMWILVRTLKSIPEFCQQLWGKSRSRALRIVIYRAAESKGWNGSLKTISTMLKTTKYILDKSKHCFLPKIL